MTDDETNMTSIKKILLAGILFFLFLSLVDAIQARVFNRSQFLLLKTTDYGDAGYQCLVRKDESFITKTYYFCDGRAYTYFIWEDVGELW